MESQHEEDVGRNLRSPVKADSPSPLLDRAVLGDSPYISRRSSPDRGVIVDSTQSTPSLRYNPQDSTVIVPRTLGISRSAFVEHDEVKYRFHIPDGQRPGCKLVVQLPGPEVVNLDWSAALPHSPSWRGSLRGGDLVRAAGLQSPDPSPGAASSLPGGEAISQEILDNYRCIDADIKSNEVEIRQLSKEVRFLKNLEKKQLELEATQSKKRELEQERANLLGQITSSRMPRQILSPRCMSPTASNSSRSFKGGGGSGSRAASLKAATSEVATVATADTAAAVSSPEGTGPAPNTSVLVPPPLTAPERSAQVTTLLRLRSPTLDSRSTLTSPKIAAPYLRGRASLPPRKAPTISSELPVVQQPPVNYQWVQQPQVNSGANVQQLAAQAAAPSPFVGYPGGIQVQQPPRATTPRSTFGYAAGISTMTSHAMLPRSRVTTISLAGGSKLLTQQQQAGAVVRQSSPTPLAAAAPAGAGDKAKTLPTMCMQKRWVGALGA